ncbi:prepilin-type N-terminal cleavage/methylation domain-containing protein [Leucobacter soli]|uniref:Prepilin-type N-terminal cleavage/methylation domain-containing protein n=1 Tax=Leucobacter soli TaxID=2812850 RepID=A0A916NFZ1_9MICO|nr:type II secretion system protein [Leucobacter soli]CAG7601042.1 hypothetical protein LEUCIP111803_00422 [Leucobacter soli]
MHRSRSDRGFTLIEVIVAITLLLVVTVAALPLIINSLQFSTAQQRQQAGVIVTQEAMEQVRVRASGLTAVAPLVAGRHSSDVGAQFTRVSTHPGVAQTNAASDPAAASGSAAALLPLQQNVRRDGTDYTVETLIGTCTQQKNGTGELRCLKTGTGNAMVRTIVVTKWTAGDACTGSPAGYCSYEAMSLINLDTDLEWSDAS